MQFSSDSNFSSLFLWLLPFLRGFPSATVPLCNQCQPIFFFQSILSFATPSETMTTGIILTFFNLQSLVRSNLTRSWFISLLPFHSIVLPKGSDDSKIKPFLFLFYLPLQMVQFWFAPVYFMFVLKKPTKSRIFPICGYYLVHDFTIRFLAEKNF